MIQAALFFALSLLLALALTPLVRAVAVHYGYVAQPKHDRWHKVSTAQFGGIAIFLAWIVPLAWALLEHPMLGVVVAGAALAFLVGLVDDIVHLKPYSKLIGQIVAACVFIAGGVTLSPELLPIISIFLTLLWLIGITNAFNLLDNMDGLSAGTAGIAAFFLMVAGLLTENMGLVLAAAGLCGAALGFLVYNFPPAKIFMGDSGSLFLGFSLAALAIAGTDKHATNLFFAMLIPVLVLAVPIFDTLFVSLVRLVNGRAISQGGKDHTSHRLVAFGLPEKTTVMLFYLLSSICGAVALLGLKYGMLYPSILAILIVIIFWYFGAFLNGVVSYGENAKRLLRESRGFTMDLVLMHKKRVGEVIVDCVLIGLSFTVAFVIRFDGLPAMYASVIAQTLPILIPLKLVTFFYFGLYRGLWRYVGMQDLINIVKAVTVSSVLAVVVVTMVFRFENYSRAVFAIDWMVLLLTVSGVRVMIRLIEEYLGSLTKQKGKRLLIFGAGDAGEIALREVRNNAKLGYVPVGFIDDDREKLGRSIHGVKILGRREQLTEIVEKFRVQEILVAIPSAERSTLVSVLKDCKQTGAAVQVMPKTARLVEPSLVQFGDLR